MNYNRRTLVATATGIATVITLSSCSALTPGGAKSTADGPASVATTLSKDKVTLTVAYADDPPTKALIAGFEKKYPQVTVKPQYTQFANYVQSIKLSMSSDSSPDVVEYNPGAMQSLIPAGLVLDLDKYSAAYGWKKSFPASSLLTLRTDKSGKQLGTGSLYAVPGGLSVLGVFYNKTLAAKIGMTSPPKTFDQFQTMMRTAKSKGVTPLEVGGLDTGGANLYGGLENALAPVGKTRDWVYGKPGATISVPGAITAAQTIIDWSKKGWIGSSANGETEQDAATKFAKGSSLFNVTGSYSASVIGKSLGSKAGFFAIPGPAGHPLVAPGGAVSYSIAAKSKHPDAAAAFLNYMSSKEAAPIQAAGGFEAVNVDAAPKQSGINAAVSAGFASVAKSKNGGIVPFLNSSAPEMLDSLKSGAQGLIARRTSAKDFVTSLQSTWSKYHK